MIDQNLLYENGGMKHSTLEADVFILLRVFFPGKMILMQCLVLQSAHVCPCRSGRERLGTFLGAYWS